MPFAGLFGVIDYGASVTGVTLENAEITCASNASAGWGDMGALTGDNYGTVSGCSAEGGSISGTSTSSSDDDEVGGLVGFSNGSLTNCYATGAITASGTGSGAGNDYTYAVGGLVGYNEGDSTFAAVTGSYATGSVTITGIGGGNDDVYFCGAGGLAGIDDGHVAGYSVSIAGSHAAGSVTITTTDTGTGNSISCIAGGLIGVNAGDSGTASITGSYATGGVTGGESYNGGLVGVNEAGGSTAAITDSYATGSVTGDDSDNGGLAGYNDGNNGTASILDTYATGSATGDDSDNGGLAGYNDGNSGTASITDSYATGGVTGSDSNNGGLAGYNSNDSGAATIGSSYWDSVATGQSAASAAGSDGSNSDNNGRTTAEMQQESNYTNVTSPNAPWDFISTWGIDNGQGYPYLVGVTIGGATGGSGSTVLSFSPVSGSTITASTTITITASPPCPRARLSTGTRPALCRWPAIIYTRAPGSTCRSRELSMQPCMTQRAVLGTIRHQPRIQSAPPAALRLPAAAEAVLLSPPPACRQKAASSITTDSAVLNGDITSAGSSDITAYGFLWGTSQGSISTTVQVGTNNQSGAFTSTLNSLTAGTTYYFEAYATNSQGTADGAVMSFTPVVQTPPPTPPPAALFSDVPASYWAYTAISSLSSQGIVEGYPDGTFKPNADITRAEFATMLVKALGLSTTGTTGQFTDVADDAWCNGCVNAAVNAGLVSGMGNGLFAPNAPITREQMAVMVANALGNKAPAVDGTELNAFSDSSSVSSWAVTGMEEAVKAGIVSGMTPVRSLPWRPPPGRRQRK